MTTISTIISRRLFALLAAGFVAAGPGYVVSASASDAPDLSKVVLRVGDQTGSDRAKLEAAGLLDDVPYTIEWSVYPAAVNLHEALKADAIDVGRAADSPTVSAIAGGSKIKTVAAWSNGGLGTSILVHADSPIKSVEDLRGKTISPTTRGSVAHYLTLGALKQAGVDPGEVKLAFLNPTDASAAFQARSIDAWTIWGIYTARTIGTLNARPLISGEGINSGLFVLSATDRALQDAGKVAAIEDYANRIGRGYKWSLENKDAYVQFYSAFSKQDPALIEQIYPHEAAYKRVTFDDAFAAELQNTHDTWVEAGVLSGKRDLNAYVYRDLRIVE